MSDPRVRVLLIEEDADDLRRARGALANIHGSTLELTTCGGTAEALDLLSRQEPELVVFGLPADGAAQRTPAERAVVELRELLAAFQGPVIVLEPGCEEELAQRLLAEGAADCVSKEWLHNGSAGLLPRVARHSLERQRLLRELDRARRLGLHLAHHAPTKPIDRSINRSVDKEHTIF